MTKEKRSLVEIIEIISRILGTLEVKAAEQLTDLTMQQFYYLDTITQLGNPTPTELARTLQLTKPSVTAIVNQFVKQGYAKKVRSQQDRRSFHIHLTEKGQQLSAVHDQIHRNLAQHFIDQLNEDEVEQLVTLLNKVIDNTPV